MHFLRAAAAATLVMLALADPARAACGPGEHTCEPSTDDARQKMQRLLDSAFVTPHTIASFEKLETRGVETKGRTVYEVRVLAVLSYSGDKLLCRVRLCPQLHNYLVQIDSRAKTAKVAGWLFFDQAAQGGLAQ